MREKTKTLKQSEEPEIYANHLKFTYKFRYQGIVAFFKITGAYRKIFSHPANKPKLYGRWIPLAGVKINSCQKT